MQFHAVEYCSAHFMIRQTQIALSSKNYCYESPCH
jgi:hypothetical protein